MPRNSRKLLDNVLSHHMVQGINREQIFKTNEEKSKYLELLKKYYCDFAIYIIAYCIMDNHAHMLLYSEQIQNISDFMRKVNTIYAMYYNKKKGRVGYVYRNRFESVPIMTRNQMYACIKYIHMNPVKAGIVEEEDKYEYSSYNDYLNQTGFINQKILKFVFNSSENYIETFKNIKYEKLSLKREAVSIEKLYSDFLVYEKTTFQEMRKNKILIQKFMSYLASKQCKSSKSEIAQILKISRATLYRRLNDE